MFAEFDDDLQQMSGIIYNEFMETKEKLSITAFPPIGICWLILSLG